MQWKSVQDLEVLLGQTPPHWLNISGECDMLCAPFLASGVIVLPRSRGDSFLLFVLCGEAPCRSSSLMFSTWLASAASVNAVSPSFVCSSNVTSMDAIAARVTNKYSLDMRIYR